MSIAGFLTDNVFTCQACKSKLRFSVGMIEKSFYYVSTMLLAVFATIAFRPGKYVYTGSAVALLLGIWSIWYSRSSLQALKPKNASVKK